MPCRLKSEGFFKHSNIVYYYQEKCVVSHGPILISKS